MVNPVVDCSGTPSPCVNYPYCWHYFASWWESETEPNPYNSTFGEGKWRENRQGKSRRLIAILRDVWHPMDPGTEELVSLIHTVHFGQSSVRHRAAYERRWCKRSLTGQNMTQSTLTLKD